MNQDKVIIITGASSGIGEATARLFGAHRYQVVLAARRLDRLQSLAKEIESAIMWASDISFEALAVARVNAKHHGLERRIMFCQGDLWQPFANSSGSFDMIVSNPPYIPSEIFKTLPKEIHRYEPRVALDGYENGIHFIKKIIEESKDYLKPSGWLLIEMDPDQTEKALYLIDKTRAFNCKERILDYQKKYRLIKAQRKNG